MAVAGESLIAVPFAGASSGAEKSPEAEAAWVWVQSQRGSAAIDAVGTITPDTSYPLDWTGAVSGTFSSSGGYPEEVNPASIVVDSPATVSASYDGVVVGHITLQPTPGRWIVQVYRDTGTGLVQVPLQTLVDPTGQFRVDLSSISSPPAGTWALGLLDAQNSYAPSGVPWPAEPVFSGWEVELFVVTDTAYFIARQAARADGTFAFAASAPGSKLFQLVSSDGTVLAQWVADTGLIRSYAGQEVTYTYDQAIAVVTALRLGTASADLVTGLMAMQLADGGFVNSADWRNPWAGVQVQRSGVSAIATYALLLWLEVVGTAGSLAEQVMVAAQQGINWLLAQQRSDGLIGAGVGDFNEDGSVDVTASPTWVSTEHNVDGWQALRLAESVLGSQEAASAAATIASAAVALLWDGSRMRQGLDPSGEPDDTDTLDVASWGSIFLRQTGQATLADEALAHASSFAASVGDLAGYRAYYPQPAFPDAPANVWSEGSAGVVLARFVAGDSGAALTDLQNLSALQDGSGGFPYALVDDTATSMTTALSTCASCWFILATLAQNGPSIWD
ncbi:hypothetical protein [Rudaeicoccus suwonensis]|uniref:Uncharacterized protein n=1 Tax=Rudaeicoccus suwonensis TaxID=657409 RepID=A0A561E8T7_9MICO|nr:hypothetical protein [Rudaeicoccus suwonensis]TWE11980.1 hypothetical protein BKA23_0776 [Rudaeicoccus suwonensis]